jgi:ribosomal protein S6--L-glutamate ligase
MRIRIGIVTVRDGDYHPNRRLFEAIHAAGHEGVLIHPYRLWPEMNKGRLCITGAEDFSLPHVLLPRQGAQIGDTSLTLIRQMEAMGIPVVNGADAIAIARNKFYTQQVLTAAGLPGLDTFLANDPKAMGQIVYRLGGYPVVAKSTSGRQGEDVLLIQNEKEAKRRVFSVLNPREGLILQQYLPPENRRDIRVLVVGGQCIAAMELKPAEGEFRANFHLGSKLRAVKLTAELRQTAVKAAAAVKLDVAGVDMMIDAEKRPTIGEVNYSPGFKGLELTTGFDIAGHIAQFTINRFVESRK